MTIGDAVLEAADRNMVQAWRSMLSVAPFPDDVHDDHAILLSSGLPVPLFNPAFVTGAPADPGETVARVIEHYESRGAPFVVYFRDEVASGLAEACAVAGLVEHWRPPLMVLDPIPTTGGDPPPDLEMKRVTTDDLEDYATVLSEGFGMPRDLAELMSSPRTLDIAGLTSLIGSARGEPIGAAAVFVSDGVAGIYNVATSPRVGVEVSARP